MADFKAVALKSVMHERKTLVFSVTGEYSTDDKEQIKTLKNAVGVEEVKASKKS